MVKLKRGEIKVRLVKERLINIETQVYYGQEKVN
jgi:hypothetical protein